MLFFWKVGLVNIFSLIQFCINTGSQYGAIVVASAAGNFSEIGPKVLFEPITGLGTSYQFIRAAQTAAERRARIATLAAFLSTSGASAVATDPATNAARTVIEKLNKYTRIKKSLEEGINPVDIGKKSTLLSSNKVLIKGDECHYLVEVFDICTHSNTKNVKNFENLMNRMYRINLRY